MSFLYENVSLCIKKKMYHCYSQMSSSSDPFYFFILVRFFIFIFFFYYSILVCPILIEWEIISQFCYEGFALLILRHSHRSFY